MWFGGANPETLDTFRSHYRPKIALLVLLYLIQHRPSSDPSPDSGTKPENLQTPSKALNLPHGLSLNVGGLGTSTPHMPSQQAAATAVKPSPVSKAYVAGQESLPFMQKGVRKEDAEDGTPMRARESTKSSSYLTQLSKSPLLSHPPAPSSGHNAASVSVKPKGSKSKQKTVSKQEDGIMEERIETEPSSTDQHEISECPIDFRGRPACPNSTRLPISLSNRSSELADAAHEFGLWVIDLVPQLLNRISTLRLSPFFLAALLLHLLLGIQLGSLLLEDAIVRIGLSNPLPKDFSRANTFRKRFSRFKWRALATSQRWGMHMLGIGLSLVVVILVGWETWQKSSCTGWEDVPFGRWLLPQVVCESQAKVWSPPGALREMIALETVGAFLSLAQPLKHLLPPSVVPPTISPKISFYHPFKSKECEEPSQTSIFYSPGSRGNARIGDLTTNQLNGVGSGVRLSTFFTLSLINEVILSTLTLIQFMRLALLLPSYSPLTVPPHILFHSARSRLLHIQRLRQTLLRTIECLETVFRVFPDSDRREKEGPLEEDDWVCTICFEGADESSTLYSSADGGDDAEMDYDKYGRSERTKCRLGCGHKYHAGCLIHWCHHQNWCPVCHVPVVPPNPVSTLDSWSSAEQPDNASAMFVQRQPDIDNSNVYPGSIRRRRTAVLPTPPGTDYALT